MNKIICLVLLSMLPVQSLPNEKVIYGEDGRKDLYQVTKGKWIESARSVAALVSLKQLKKVKDLPGFRRLGSSTLYEEEVCRDEKFTSQMTASQCSGFLVGHNILITAGHCIKSLKTCKKTRWVFGYDLETREKDYTLVSEEDMFECSEVIAFYSGDHEKEPDYSILRLKRSVAGRKPLKLRKKGRIKKGEGVYIAGFPLGLPLKIAGGAWVRKNPRGPYFSTNLDSFEGNSGGPVFNEKDHLVEGILVSGEDDFYWDSKKGCYRIRRCSQNSCSGENATKIRALKELDDLLSRKRSHKSEREEIRDGWKFIS